MKGRKGFLIVCTLACAIQVGLFTVKIMKNLSNASITESAIVILSIVCLGLCKMLWSDTNSKSS